MATMETNETQLPALGTPAPDFTLMAGDGSSYHLADLKGQPVVLYFYPKDDTPGCTTEACSFRDAWGQLQAQGVAVLGVSRDDVKSHTKFASKYQLPFPLLADPGGAVAQRYGVWVQKSMYGKQYMTMARTTFYFRRDGTIGHVWAQVKPEGHAEDVLRVVAADLAHSGGN
ncbi:MAG: peroxiredoxin [Ktedonobacterales bacterium]